MPALERLYTMAPSFRAEKSRTRRHLTEFWHAEMEIAWASNDDVMVHGEGVVRNIASTLLDKHSDDLSNMGRDLELISRYRIIHTQECVTTRLLRRFKGWV